MKNIKEKQFLVNMALALGQTPDPALIKEINEHKVLMDSITTRGDEFGDFLAQLAQLKNEVETVKQVVEVKQQYFNSDNYPKPPTLDELMALVPDEVAEPIVEKQIEEKPIEVKVKEKLSPLIAAASEHITKEVQMEAVSFEPPELDPMMRSLNDLRNKIKQLENKITNIASSPGSGEVNLLRLDDVDTSDLGNGKFLRYSAANAKMEFATVSGGGAVDSVNGQTGVISLTTSDISEGTNLYFTNARVYSNVTSIGYATNANVALKANVVDLTTANVTELTNLYFTNARSIAALTAGTNITLAANGLISSTASGGSSNLLAVSSAIVPDADSVYDLGTANLRWGTLFLANNTINLGGSLISSDGTGIITISSLGAVLPVNSKVTVDGADKQIALVGNTGAIATVVPFFTKELGLNTTATNFTFGANPDDFVFTNFTFSNGSTITQSARALFYF